MWKEFSESILSVVVGNLSNNFDVYFNKSVEVAIKIPNYADIESAAKSKGENEYEKQIRNEWMFIMLKRIKWKLLFLF